jgi:hypothetical protein
MLILNREADEKQRRQEMARKRSTTMEGNAFSEEIIAAVWRKAATITGKHPAEYRRDILGNELRRESYGKESGMGWEIDHIIPVAKGGTDLLGNLQPLQSSANAQKGDTYPWP